MDIEQLSEEQLKDIKRAFTIFILKVIKHSAIDFARKEKVQNSRIVPISEYVNNEMSLSNFDDGIFFIQEDIDYENLEKIMSKKKHCMAISKLSKREKQIIYLLYIKEKDVEEIAAMLQLTPKTILNTKNNALNKLRNDMEE